MFISSNRYYWKERKPHVQFILVSFYYQYSLQSPFLTTNLFLWATFSSIFPFLQLISFYKQHSLQSSFLTTRRSNITKLSFQATPTHQFQNTSLQYYLTQNFLNSMWFLLPILGFFDWNIFVICLSIFG